MLSKYAETASNINHIETIVEALMTELGIGGFMDVQDMKPGMKAMIYLSDNTRKPAEYHGELLENRGHELLIHFEKPIPFTGGSAICKLQVTAGHVLYCWNTAEITAVSNENISTPPEHNYILLITTRPQIINRRKYPRMEVHNDCIITFTEGKKSYRGRLDNISANGFAFVCSDNAFADAKGAELVVESTDSIIPSVTMLKGKIIRSSNNDGTFFVGCQMPEDNYEIMKYVKTHLAEND